MYEVFCVQFLHSDLGVDDYDQVNDRISKASNSGLNSSHTRKTSRNTGGSSTDVNSDSDWDSLVCLPPAEGNVDKNSESSRTEINSDDDCIEIIEHTEPSLERTTTFAWKNSVTMYGGHEISDSSEGEELPSPTGSKALSISSGDDLSMEESKPLSSLLCDRGSSCSSPKPKATIDIIMDCEELPDLDSYEPMDSVDSNACTDSLSVPSSVLSQASGDNLSCSQTSGMSTSSGSMLALDGKVKKKRRTPEEIAEVKRQAEVRSKGENQNRTCLYKSHTYS